MKSHEIPIDGATKKYEHMLLFIYRRAWLMGTIKTSNGVERRRACGDRSAGAGRGRAPYWSVAIPLTPPLARHYRSTPTLTLPLPLLPVRVRRAPPATPCRALTQRNHTPFRARNESRDFPIQFTRQSPMDNIKGWLIENADHPATTSLRSSSEKSVLQDIDRTAARIKNALGLNDKWKLKFGEVLLLVTNILFVKKDIRNLDIFTSIYSSGLIRLWSQ